MLEWQKLDSTGEEEKADALVFSNEVGSRSRRSRRPGWWPLLSQMTMCERNTGSGFQVAFKGDSTTLVAEFNDNINRPRTMLGRVGAAGRIVLG